jgi:hypothetical protein
MRDSIIPMNLNFFSSLVIFLIILMVCFGRVRMSIPSRSIIAARIMTIVCHTMFFGTLKNIKMYL